MKIGLVWFKNDLRLHDNEALCSAIADCDTILCCYCVEPYWFKQLDLGFRKADINRFKFIEQSVKDLQGNLEDLGAQLHISSKGAVKTIPQLVEKFGINAIYAEEEYASEELS